MMSRSRGSELSTTPRVTAIRPSRITKRGWACCRALANVLVVNGEPGAIIYQAGFLIDSIGGFLFVRFLIRNEEDILRVIKIFAALTVIFAITMSVEKFRGLNIFGYLGIVSVIPGSREGSIRAAGAFAHPILAGVFGVAVMPLFWWLRQSGKARVAGLLGLCGSMGMMVMSASSTPLMSFVAAIIAGFAFPFSQQNAHRSVGGGNHLDRASLGHEGAGVDVDRSRGCGGGEFGLPPRYAG